VTPTFSPDSLLALRFQASRPGLELTAIVDAGLPVAMLTADVLAQDRKPLPLLEEFVLRLVGADIATEDGITGFLGLPKAMVTQTIAEHFSHDNLTYASAGYGRPSAQQPLRLTSRGAQTARDLASITPQDLSLPLVYDQLLCKVRPYDRNAIITRRQAEEDRLLLLPSARSSPVETSDVSAAEINALLRARGDVGREVLLVKRVSQAKARRVMPAKVLVYADTDRRDTQLAVVVDDELSPAHELALIEQGGAAALGIQVQSPPQRPTLDPDLERARVPLPEVTRQRTSAAALRLGVATPVPEEPAPAEPAREEIRAVSVFEHPDLLDEALTQAGQRILLISPWVRKAVVNTDFLSKLEGRLRRRVTVHIAHGYERDDSGSDPDAIRRLKNLASRYQDYFTFTRLKSTHAKILIFDNVWIATSFNWLSFRGDRDRTYRMEEGTLVRNQQAVNSQYERYLAQIAQDRQ
jgi:phosphatidylserine/phosphatidylglycerophosphate/cardiolipin synthase-like enzyme